MVVGADVIGVVIVLEIGADAGVGRAAPLELNTSFGRGGDDGVIGAWRIVVAEHHARQRPIAGIGERIDPGDDLAVAGVVLGGEIETVGGARNVVSAAQYGVNPILLARARGSGAADVAIDERPAHRIRQAHMAEIDGAKGAVVRGGDGQTRLDGIAHENRRSIGEICPIDAVRTARCREDIPISGQLDPHLVSETTAGVVGERSVIYIPILIAPLQAYAISRRGRDDHVLGIGIVVFAEHHAAHRPSIGVANRIDSGDNRSIAGAAIRGEIELVVGRIQDRCRCR